MYIVFVGAESFFRRRCCDWLIVADLGLPTAFCLLHQSRDLDVSLNSAVGWSVRLPYISSAAGGRGGDGAGAAQQQQQQQADGILSAARES